MIHRRMPELAASHAGNQRLLVIGIIFVVAGAGNLVARWLRARYPGGTRADRPLSLPGVSPRVDVTLSAVTTIVGVVLVLGNL